MQRWEEPEVVGGANLPSRSTTFNLVSYIIRNGVVRFPSMNTQLQQCWRLWYCSYPKQNHQFTNVTKESLFVQFSNMKSWVMSVCLFVFLEPRRESAFKIYIMFISMIVLEATTWCQTATWDAYFSNANKCNVVKEQCWKWKILNQRNFIRVDSPSNASKKYNKFLYNYIILYCPVDKSGQLLTRK